MEQKVLPFILSSNCNLTKAVGEEKKGLAQLEGILSTQTIDTQGEELIIKGMDISYLNSGYAQLNWWHLGTKDPNMVIGVIDSAKKINDDTAVYFKAHLFDTSNGRAALELMQAFEAEGKKLGVSVEGATILREGSKIYKSVARGAALATDQVNKECTASLCKALMGYTPSDDINSLEIYKAVFPTGDAPYDQNPLTSTNLGIESNNERTNKVAKLCKRLKSDAINNIIYLDDAISLIKGEFPNMCREFLRELIISTTNMNKEDLFMSRDRFEEARAAAAEYASAFSNKGDMHKAVDTDFFEDPQAAILNEDSLQKAPDSIVALAAFMAQAVEGLQKAITTLNEKIEFIGHSVNSTSESVLKANIDCLDLMKANLDETPISSFKSVAPVATPKPLTKATSSMSLEQITDRLEELCKAGKITPQDISRYEVHHQLPDYIKAML